MARDARKPDNNSTMQATSYQNAGTQTGSTPPWYKANDILKFVVTLFSLISVYTTLYLSYINTLNKIAQLELKIDQLHFELNLSEKEKLLLIADSQLLRHQIDSLKSVARSSPKKDLFPSIPPPPPHHDSGFSQSSEPAKSPSLGTIKISWPENWTGVDIVINDTHYGPIQRIPNLPYGKYNITLKRGSTRTKSISCSLKSSVDSVRFESDDFN